MDFTPVHDVYGPPDIFTSNLYEDIRLFFFKDEIISIKDIEQKILLLDLGNRRKLTVVTERVEFVNHLLRLRNLLADHRVDCEPDRMYTDGDSLVVEIPDKIEFHGMEFNGVDHDIDSLCFYLLLTCIECIEGPAEFLDMAVWLERNWDTLSGPNEAPQTFIRRIKEEYYNRYGARRTFSRAFLEHLPNNLRIRLITHFAVVQLSERQLDASSWQRWQQLTEEQKVKQISHFFYDEVRSKFTHESHRSFFPDTPVRNLLAKPGYVLIALVPQTEDNLLSLLQELLCVLVKNNLG